MAVGYKINQHRMAKQRKNNNRKSKRLNVTDISSFSIRFVYLQANCYWIRILKRMLYSIYVSGSKKKKFPTNKINSIFRKKILKKNHFHPFLGNFRIKLHNVYFEIEFFEIINSMFFLKCKRKIQLKSKWNKFRTANHRLPCLNWKINILVQHLNKHSQFGPNKL